MITGIITALVKLLVVLIAVTLFFGMVVLMPRDIPPSLRERKK